MTGLVTPYDLTMAQPKQIRAYVDDSWHDIAIPRTEKGQPRWKLVHETLSSMQATRIQLLDDTGTILKAVGDGPAAQAPAPAPAGGPGIDLDTFAARLADAQRVALTAHVEAMKPAWAAVEAHGKLVSEMAKQMTQMLGAASEVTKNQQELVAKLADLLSDVTDDAVSARLEGAELAAQASENQAEQSDRVAGLMEKALELVGPAVAQRLAPH